MIKMLTTCTREIDLVDRALSEVLERLNLESGLLKHSVGVLTCSPEFVESGVVRALCGRLSFDVVGCTSLSSATCGEYDSELLTLAVLTSDDVTFSSAVSGPISPAQTAPQISSLYQRAAEVLPEKPTMALTYLPLSPATADTSLMVRELDKVSGGIPVFGSTACDNSPTFVDKCGVIHNGAFYSESASLLLMQGNIKPRFFLGSVDHFEEMRKQHGIVTESEGNTVKKINDMLFLDYFTSIGLPISELIYPALPVPFMANYHDGAKSVARVLHTIAPEGWGVFTAEMPVGVTIAVHRLDGNGVLATAESMARTLARLKDVSGFLIHSCALRYMLLGLRAGEEARLGLKPLHDGTPYQFSYSGGEICPLVSEAGDLLNRSHNFSFIACAF
ncbi:MAG: FIST C-terminal domain-containing protein [Synergistaceae bacterium]|jgi:hypothetical protein|nr:FIST C-terminal domain-containing protein [Synergistaceae bacterium]